MSLSTIMPSKNSTSDAVNSYTDLIAWQKAMDLVCMTYEITANFPKEERYGLVAQMRRCAVSMPSNIAEGWGRRSSADYVRFLQMACGSSYELVTQGELCRRLNMPGDWFAFKNSCEEVGRILNALITSIRRKNNIPDPTFKRQPEPSNS